MHLSLSRMAWSLLKIGSRVPLVWIAHGDNAPAGPIMTRAAETWAWSGSRARACAQVRGRSRALEAQLPRVARPRTLTPIHAARDKRRRRLLRTPKSKCAGSGIFGEAEAEADLGGSGAREVGEAAREEIWDLSGPAKQASPAQTNRPIGQGVISNALSIARDPALSNRMGASRGSLL